MDSHTNRIHLRTDRSNAVSINQFTIKDSKTGLTEGEPIVEPDYSTVEDMDAFSVRLPDGRILNIEVDIDSSGFHSFRIFIMTLDSNKILEKLL